MTGTYDPWGQRQRKKGQGETNDRLDQLYGEQQRTNQLLEWIGLMVHVQLTPDQQAEVARLSAGKPE
jgi:hypothetical protein